MYYFILLVETKFQTTERACSFEQLPAQVNRNQTIILRQVIDLSTTATTITGVDPDFGGPTLELQFQPSCESKTKKKRSLPADYSCPSPARFIYSYIDDLVHCSSIEYCGSIRVSRVRDFQKGGSMEPFEPTWICPWIKGARYYGLMCFQHWHSTYFNKPYRNLLVHKLHRN